MGGQSRERVRGEGVEMGGRWLGIRDVTCWQPSERVSLCVCFKFVSVLVWVITHTRMYLYLSVFIAVGLCC